MPEIRDMIKDTILLSSLINFMIINSALVGDEVQYICRSLPALKVKQYKRKRIDLTGALEDQEQDEIQNQGVINELEDTRILETI